jgi:hypothetical protein
MEVPPGRESVRAGGPAEQPPLEEWRVCGPYLPVRLGVVLIGSRCAHLPRHTLKTHLAETDLDLFDDQSLGVTNPQIAEKLPPPSAGPACKTMRWG